MNTNSIANQVTINGETILDYLLHILKLIPDPTMKPHGIHYISILETRQGNPTKEYNSSLFQIIKHQT